MGNIVVYKNELNTVPLRDFRAIEMDLFFSILAEMRDKGEDRVILSFQELKELSNYQATAIDRFVADIERTYDKLIGLNVKLGNSHKWTKFVLFTEYTVDLDTETISIKTNPEFTYLINQLKTAFTRLELEELTSLRSSYSKALYRQLKQYRTTGIALYTVEDFRERMCIPESYQMYNINQKIIDPAIAELQPYFKHLKCTRIKGTGKNKRKTVSLQFSFEADTGVQFGKRTFRDAEGNYYEKDLMEFTNEEVDKAYPDAPQRQLDRQEKIELEKLLGKDITGS